MSDEGRTIRRPKAWDKFDAMMLLQEKIIADADDLLCEYVDDWSDDKVAETTGLAVTTIAELRKQRYGTLRPKRKPTQEDLFTRLEELEKRVQALENMDADVICETVQSRNPTWNGAGKYTE